MWVSRTLTPRYTSWAALKPVTPLSTYSLLWSSTQCAARDGARSAWLQQNCAGQEDHGFQEQQGPGLERQYYIGCTSTFNQTYSSSEISWDAKLVEKRFETDMNLNF